MFELDVGTRALLKLILLPPGGLLVLLLIGWLMGRRLFGRLLVLLGIVGLYALSTPVVVGHMAARLETVPAPSAAEIRQSGAEAILVFMADVRRANPELAGADALSALSLQRLDHALALHRQTGLPLILAGGSVKGETVPLARLGEEWLRERAGVPVLALDTASRDTRENARNAHELLRANGLGRVLLVTHAFHMPRALMSAREAGIDAVPAPFAFIHRPPELQEPEELNDWLPQAGALAQSYLVLHELAGIGWQRLTR